MSLNKTNLINHLSAQNTYKQTKPYIQQIQSQNQDIYDIVSEALLQIFKSKEVTLIAKMQALKFFKQIFQTGEFNCIEALDQNIENHLLEVAQYKKQLKQLNKGENYFIQVQNRPNNKQTKQFGVSYVLFVLEMLVNFANWYPKDFEGERSRFAIYVLKLQKQAIVLPKLTELKYFKPTDKEKFLNNYKRWIKKQNELLQKQKGQQDSQINQGKQKDQNKEDSQLNQASKANQKRPSIINQDKSKQVQSKQSNIIKQSVESNINKSNQVNQKSQVPIKTITQEMKKIDELNQKIKQLQAQLSNQQLKLKKKYQSQSLAKLNQIRKSSDQKQQQMKKKYLIQQENYLNKIELMEENQKKMKQEIDKFQNKIKFIETNKSVLQSSKMQNEIKQIKTQLRNKDLQINSYEQKIKKLKQQLQKKQEIQKTYKEEISNLKKIIQNLQTQLELLNKKNIDSKDENQSQKLRNQKNEIQNKNIKNQDKQKIQRNSNQQIQFPAQYNMFKQAPTTIDYQNKPLKSNKLSRTQNRSNQKKNLQLGRNFFSDTNHRFELNYQTNGKTQKGFKHIDLKNNLKSNQYTPNIINKNSYNLNTSYSPNSKKSIFGLKDIAGIQMKFVQEYFDPVTLSMTQFRRACSKNKQIFYSNKQIAVYLQEYIRQKTFKITIKNISASQLKIEWNLILNKNFTLTKQKFKTSFDLAPGQIQQQWISVQINSLNFRFIQTNIRVGMYKMNLPLPITLLKFCRFLKYQKKFQEENNEIIKTQEFFIEGNFQTIEQYFHHYLTIDTNQRFQGSTLVTYEFQKDILIGLKIKGFKNKCVIQGIFNKLSAKCEGFAKILLQLLMFCFRIDA